MALSLKFCRQQRLHRAEDFASLRGTRARVDGIHSFLKYGFLAREDQAPPLARIAMVVGKKIGPSCFRHRLKRLMREAFRQHQHELPSGIDLLWVARRDIPAQWEWIHREFQSFVEWLQPLSQEERQTGN
ncbi:MAG: ribonuclease P protein component [Puniceicoccales bacterium]|nr:ribonuclease P protein component [Puniceicoccales bacterium]